MIFYRKNHPFFLTSLFVILTCLLSLPAQAQDCGCDYTISPSQSFIRASDVPAVKPGSTVCIKGGVRGRLKLVGFQGTKELPITFKNCGGKVIFDNTTVDGTFIFENSRYFRVTGTGDPLHTYGFLVRTASKGSAMYVTQSDFELDHIEIADAGFAGIMAKIDPNCTNTQYHRASFVMQNVIIRDNYIHGTYGEGMYIGSTSYTGKSTSCGTLMPHEIHGLRIFNNRVENTGADGIQVASATRDVEVYNNTIRKYGQDPFKAVQNNGLMIGGGSTGRYYNNKVIDGSGIGIICFGIGNVYLYNNLVVRAGLDGIFIDERSALLPNSGFHAHNNTVVSPARDGIRMQSRNSVGNTFYNNLLVAPGSLSTNYYNKNQYLYIIDNTVKYSQSNNLFIATTKEALFADLATDNYLLQAISPAVEKGKTLSYFNFDHNRTPRPQGSYYDIGAYEFNGTQRITNNPPVVSAGADKSISLPTNSLSLSGTASDADGSIASVSWSKLSGPSLSMSGATNLKLSLSNLLEGTYVFRFTAKDNAGATAYDDVKVVVHPAPSSSGILAPSNLAGKTNAYKTGIGLSWTDNSTNESGFEIHLSIGNNSSYKQVGSTGSNKTSYTVGISSGQTYYIKIRAKGSTGYSNYSNEIIIVVGTSSTSRAATSSSDIFTGSDSTGIDGTSLASTLPEAPAATESMSKISAYPNPFSDYVDLSLGSEMEGTISIQLTDLSGSLRFEEKIQAEKYGLHRINLNRSSLKPGLYILSISNGLNKQSLKLLKN